MGIVKHTPGPWFYDKHEAVLCDEKGLTIGRFHAGRKDDGNRAVPRLADARRIVACVNACEGIPTEALEAGAVSEMLEALEGLLKLHEAHHNRPEHASARAIIRKAKGDSHG